MTQDNRPQWGGVVVSGDQLDLDAIERQSDRGFTQPARTVLALVAEVRRLRAKVERVRDQLQHECPHGEMSWSGVDQTPLDDPDNKWACDNCGKVLDSERSIEEGPACNCDLPPIARLVLCPVHYRSHDPA